MLTKSRWLPLSAVCFNSGLTESKLLRASAVVKEKINTVCLTVEQCHHKFLSLETGGYFFSGTFPSKGCYMKNRNVWFGSGGTDEEMAETELPGILTRVWCDIEAGTPTFTVAEISDPFASVVDSPTSKPMPNQLANVRSKRPTPQPSKNASNGVIHVIDKVLLPPSDDFLPDWFDNDQMDLVDPTINFNKLYPGQFICSRPYSVNRYRFGVTQSGNVVWMDTAAQGETITLFENKNSTDIYFSLRVDATMVVTDDTTGTVLWESSPVNLEHPMSHHPRCLSDHDCPYFHLHSDGVLVMNYIPDDGAGWQAKQMFQVYGV